jgi:hypothetical protein
VEQDLSWHDEARAPWNPHKGQSLTYMHTFFSWVLRKAKFDCVFVAGAGRLFPLQLQTSPPTHWRPSAMASEGGSSADPAWMGFPEGPLVSPTYPYLGGIDP